MRRFFTFRLSISTFVLSLLGYSCSMAYSRQKGFPISTYVETCLLCAQCCVMTVACAVLQRRSPWLLAVSAVVYATGMRYLMFDAPPRRLLAALQAAATTLMTVSLLPQIAMNFKTRSGGQWSAITATLSVVGNAIRIFTTLQLTKDKLLLGGFLLGWLLNSTLLWQVLAFAK